MSDIDTESGVRELNALAQRELQQIQQRVEQFQEVLRQQVRRRMRIDRRRDRLTASHACVCHGRPT